MTTLFVLYLLTLPFGIWSHYRFFKKINPSGKSFEWSGFEMSQFVMTLMFPIMPLIADAIMYLKKR